jgi:hypothetical protein
VRSHVVRGAGRRRVIVSACESTPYGLAVDVQRQDQFWIKSQPYSLQDMLAGDESAGQFVGGTVYQAFLSATNYHRWHSPVAGTIVRAFVQEGTYYSEAYSEGAKAVEPRNSQSYLAHVATRAVILIQADNPVIGLTAFVPVGMSEVSSRTTRILPWYESALSSLPRPQDDPAEPCRGCGEPELALSVRRGFERAASYSRPSAGGPTRT